MKKTKLSRLKNVLLGILIILLVMNILGLAFSLPTTFKEVVLDKIIDDEQLVLTTIDTERIARIEITKYLESGERIEVDIEDKEIIDTLLNNEVRLYRMDKILKSTDEYELYIRFYGSRHRYFIGEDFIRVYDGNYKVLDEHNEVYESVKALFEEGNN